MAKITVNVPDTVIDEHTQTKIKQLESKLSREITAKKKVEAKLVAAERKVASAERILEATKQFLRAAEFEDEFYSEFFDRGW